MEMTSGFSLMPLPLLGDCLADHPGRAVGRPGKSVARGRILQIRPCRPVVPPTLSVDVRAAGELVDLPVKVTAAETAGTTSRSRPEPSCRGRGGRSGCRSDLPVLVSLASEPTRVVPGSRRIPRTVALRSSGSAVEDRPVLRRRALRARSPRGRLRRLAGDGGPGSQAVTACRHRAGAGPPGPARSSLASCPCGARPPRPRRAGRARRVFELWLRHGVTRLFAAAELLTPVQPRGGAAGRVPALGAQAGLCQAPRADPRGQPGRARTPSGRRAGRGRARRRRGDARAWQYILACEHAGLMP